MNSGQCSGLAALMAVLGILGLTACSDPAPQPAENVPHEDTVAPEWKLGVKNPVYRVREVIKTEFSDTKISGEVNRETNEIWREKLGALADNADFQNAEQMRQSQQFSAARDVYDDLLRLYPNASGLYRRIGDCDYNLLELAPAIDAYEKASKLNPENYFAMRGLAFARLYYGHSLWDSHNLAKAHEQYGIALKLLQRCTRIYPADYEALYGRSMAAEGASRRLYQSAVALRKSGKNEQAAAAARNCLEVIDEGIESGKQRANKMANEVTSRNVIAGLYQRRALLCREFAAFGNSTDSIEQAAQAYQAILKIDPSNTLAKQESEKCEQLLARWREADAQKDDRSN